MMPPYICFTALIKRCGSNSCFLMRCLYPVCCVRNFLLCVLRLSETLFNVFFLNSICKYHFAVTKAVNLPCELYVARKWILVYLLSPAPILEDLCITIFGQLITSLKESHSTVSMESVSWQVFSSNCESIFCQHVGSVFCQLWELSSLWDLQGCNVGKRVLFSIHFPWMFLWMSLEGAYLSALERN